MTRNGIGLMSPCGWGNLGDAAIQDSMIAGIRARRPHASLLGLTLNPHDTVARHGIAAFPVGARERFGHLVVDTDLKVPLEPHGEGAAGPSDDAPPRLRTALKRISALRTAVLTARRILATVLIPWVELRHAARAFRLARGLDTLAVSGGGQIDETWGGPWGVPWDLFKWSLVARWARTRFVVVSVGAESLRSRWSRVFIRAALDRAAYRSYRDDDSRQAVGRLHVPGEHVVAADLAFGLDVTPAPRPRGSGTTEAVVGLSPMSFSHPRGWPAGVEAVYRQYLETLRSFVRWILARGHPVVMFATDGGDARSIEDLLESLGGQASLITVPRVDSVHTLFEALAGVDLVVASRLHAALLSVVAERPVLGVAYHHKVRVQLTEVGLGPYCVDLRGATVEALQDRFAALARDADALVVEMRRRVADYRSVLRAQFDRLFGAEGTR